jgi:Skp family chaperone for outer membrane proteins
VVDIVRVFNTCKKTQAIQEDLNKQREAMNKEVETRRKKIDNIMLLLMELKPGSPEHLRLQQEALKEGFDLKSYQEFMKQKLLIQHRLHTEKIYEELLSEIADHARRHGFTLILALEEVKIRDSKSLGELQAKIAQKKVLYHTKAIDLTEPILKQVDAKYKPE